jgi:single-strand DNA-binding protein
MSTGYINVTAIGTVGKDPETRSTSSGKKVSKFSIAIDQGYGESKKTEWVNIVAWEKLADLVEKYVKKGKQIALSGTLQTTSWDDKTSGTKKYKTEVVARDISFMDSSSSSENQSTRAERPTPATRQVETPAPRATTPTDSFEDELPF